MATMGRTRRIDKLSGGACRLDNYAAVQARMAPFMAAGFEAICRDRIQARGGAGDSQKAIDP